MQRQMAEEFPPPESEDYGTGERMKGHSTSVSDFSEFCPTQLKAKNNCSGEESRGQSGKQASVSNEEGNQRRPGMM